MNGDGSGLERFLDASFSNADAAAWRLGAMAIPYSSDLCSK